MFYIDPTDKVLICSKPVICDFCKATIFNKFFLNCQWSRKGKPQFKKSCLHCVGKIRKLAEVDENYLFIISNEIKQHYQQWIPTPPQLGSPRGNISTFEAGALQGEGEIIDNTKLAGRPNCTFNINDNRERIAISEFQDKRAIERTEERVKELEAPIGDLNEFFGNITESKLVIENEERKLLE